MARVHEKTLRRTYILPGVLDVRLSRNSCKLSLPRRNSNCRYCFTRRICATGSLPFCVNPPDRAAQHQKVKKTSHLTGAGGAIYGSTRQGFSGLMRRDVKTVHHGNLTAVHYCSSCLILQTRRHKCVKCIDHIHADIPRTHLSDAQVKYTPKIPRTI